MTTKTPDNTTQLLDMEMEIQQAESEIILEICDAIARLEYALDCIFGVPDDNFGHVRRFDVGKWLDDDVAHRDPATDFLGDMHSANPCKSIKSRKKALAERVGDDHMYIDIYLDSDEKWWWRD